MRTGPYAGRGTLADDGARDSRRGEATEVDATSRRGKRGKGQLTVRDIYQSKLTPIANENWALGHTTKPFNAKLVEDLYNEELAKSNDGLSDRVTVLELSGYLENYLWKHFDPKTATPAHILSIMVMVNEKFRESLINVWEPFHSRREMMNPFFQRVLGLKQERELSIREKIVYILFITHCFASVEDAEVRRAFTRLSALSLWKRVSKTTVLEQLRLYPDLKTPWVRMLAEEARNAKLAARLAAESAFLPELLDEFLGILASITRPAHAHSDADTAERILYCERFLELVIDLLSQLWARRFFLALIQDRHLLAQCFLSPLYKAAAGPRSGAAAASASASADMDTKEDGEDAQGGSGSASSGPGKLFSQLLDRVKFYVAFEVDPETGNALTDQQLTASHLDKIQALQRTAFKHFQPTLKELAVAPVSLLSTRDALTEHLQQLDASSLRILCERLKLIAPADQANANAKPAAGSSSRAFLLEVLLSHLELKTFQRQQVKQMPLYPTERILWDEHIVPSADYDGESVLALPKLNLQFLTLYDYLLRNFTLFRLESTYEIREDIASTLLRLKPRLSAGGQETVFTGWARMAIPLASFAVTQVRKPQIGDVKPAAVRAEATVDLTPFTGKVRKEWEEIKQHDVVFLITVRASRPLGDSAAEEKLLVERGVDWDALNASELGVVYVRGAEVLQVLDEAKEVVGEREGSGRIHVAEGNLRTYRLDLDAAQYQQDQAAALQGDEDVYATFNLLLRRKPKENNFKSVLKTIRDLMDANTALPDWLTDVFLGYGDPRAAHYHKLPSQLDTIDFRDTFIDAKHLQRSFPGGVDMSPDAKPEAPFRLSFPRGVAPDFEALHKLMKEQAEAQANAESEVKQDAAAATESKASGSGSGIRALAAPCRPRLSLSLCGGGAAASPRRNRVPFTPVQVEAVKSGVNPGLTMVVGPPGTGKTDVAVQIMSELFHNFPHERTLLVTHSNHALNDLFQKIMERDIDERYLLRLGHGSEALTGDKDFSRFGRVNDMLQRRLDLLDKVAKLARAFGMPDDAAYTCETAAHFFLYHVLAKWEKFQAQVAKQRQAGGSSSDLQGWVRSNYPFLSFLSDELGPDAVFKPLPAESEGEKKGCSLDDDLAACQDGFEAVKQIFLQLEECRPFELLRTYKDRSAYLLTKHAKVIAMTCTHAAIKRGELASLRFQYDNLIMEEAGQILEIETFIPMVLQESDPESGSRLKRVILLGDHQQLPPVIKNRAFQKFSHMDQSLFTRLIRLGMPHIQLNAQGRMRPSLAALWNWRYTDIINLPAVTTSPAFQLAVPGFAHDFQFVNVDDYLGHGETQPFPYFYQNLGEAEYVVQTFMYMRLMGIAAHRISIITTYNGQKALIRDILNHRCANNPLFGLPDKVSTVDKFQGQQNDFVLLSMVRTRNAGHIRDVRRLVVAMSRARLGLYIFGRQSLYQNCFELVGTFNVLLSRPTQLQLVPNERNWEGSTLRKLTDSVLAFTVTDVAHMGKIVQEETVRAMSEYGAYQKRLQEWEASEREKRETLERKEREQREKMQAMLREEAEEEARLAKEKAFAEETAKFDAELAEQGQGTAAMEEAAEENEDASDDDR